MSDWWTLGTALLVQAKGGGWFALAGAVVAAFVTGVLGFLSARRQARAEIERLREELENRFGTSQRAVYRHFLLHLERHGEARL